MSEVIEKQRFELESWNYARLNWHQVCVLVHTCHSLGLSKRNLPGHVCPQSLKGLIFSFYLRHFILSGSDETITEPSDLRLDMVFLLV